MAVSRSIRRSASTFLHITTRLGKRQPQVISLIFVDILVESMVQMIQIMLEDKEQNGISFIRSSDDTIRNLARRVLLLMIYECSL